VDRRASDTDRFRNLCGGALSSVVQLHQMGSLSIGQLGLLTTQRSLALARSLPDARDIAVDVTRNGVRLNLGGSVYDPSDPIGRLFSNVLGMVARR